MKRRIGSLTIKEKLRFDYLTAKAQWETVKLAGILATFALIMTAVLVWALLFTSSFCSLLVIGGFLSGFWVY